MRGKKVYGGVWMSPKWYLDTFGLKQENPFTVPLECLVDIEVKKQKLLYDKYGDIPLGNANPDPYLPVPQYDGRDVCAYVYGGGEPKWDYETASFWHDRNKKAWGWVESVQDVMKIKVPDWNNNTMVQRMLEKFDEAKSLTSYIKDGKYVLNWAEFIFDDPRNGKKYDMGVFMGVVDLGPFLYGDTDFFAIMASEHDLAYAIMDKCFEISISYSEYLMKHYGINIDGLCGFGGDFSCLLSPAMYRDFVMKYDKKLLERYGEFPCNLHSCGMSVHLYDIWSTYKNKNNIVCMQTRGVPGKISHLKKCLPDTYLQITIHQPQFEFENESPENIEKLLWNYSKEADFENLALSVIVVKPGDETDENIRTFFRVLNDINKYASKL